MAAVVRDQGRSCHRQARRRCRRSSQLRIVAVECNGLANTNWANWLVTVPVRYVRSGPGMAMVVTQPGLSKVTGSSLDDQLAGPALADAADSEVKVRGLLHDLGHELMTLSLLADSVREDNALSADSRQRMELVMQEMLRIADIIADSVPTHAPAEPPGQIDVRALANDVAQLAGFAYDTTVTVAPGQPAIVQIRASLMWRVLANLVDNAVRAAGPGGRVDIRIEHELGIVLEITDNGPGFGAGRAGEAGLGLTVVRQLLRTAGGHLDVAETPDGGARVRVTLGLGG